MLGLAKLLTVIAASLLLFDGLRELDWARFADDPTLLSGVDLLLRGKQVVASLFDRLPWFPAASASAMQIEAAVAALGVIGLMITNRLTVSEFLGKLVLTSIVLGIVFLFAGPGRQIIANLGEQISAPRFASAPAPRPALSSTASESSFSSPGELTKAQCMALIAQIEFRQRFPINRLHDLAELQIPPIRQLFIENNCDRYGLALP